MNARLFKPAVPGPSMQDQEAHPKGSFLQLLPSKTLATTVPWCRKHSCRRDGLWGCFEVGLCGSEFPLQHATGSQAT